MTVLQTCIIANIHVKINLKIKLHECERLVIMFTFVLSQNAMRREGHDEHCGPFRPQVQHEFREAVMWVKIRPCVSHSQFLRQTFKSESLFTVFYSRTVKMMAHGLSVSSVCPQKKQVCLKINNQKHFRNNTYIVNNSIK